MTQAIIIECYHHRVRIELTRVFKNFVDQRLSFERLRQNVANYALMATGFFAFESFKRVPRRYGASERAH